MNINEQLVGQQQFCLDPQVTSTPDPPLTGQLADKPTRGQASRGLDNSQTGQVADNELKKTWNYYTH